MLSNRMVASPDCSFDDDRKKALNLLKRFGWNATSFQTLEPGFLYWFRDEAYVAYVDTGKAWVVAGVPVGSTEHLHLLAQEFVQNAHEQGRRICFFGAETRFLEQTSFAAVPIGEQPVWDPSDWEAVIRGSRNLKEQLRRARAKDVQVTEVSELEIQTGGKYREAVEGLIERWLAAKPMPPMGFLVQMEPFLFAGERRFFVAERAGKLIGFLALVPVYLRQGWFFEDLVRDETAPNGTAELLIHSAMQSIAHHGSNYATLGLAALSGGVTGWLRRIRDWTQGLYNFEGLRAFREKLKPNAWMVIYLAFPSEQNLWLTFYDVLMAFSRKGLLRFGFQSLVRVPEIALRILALLLIPWICLLAAINPSRWFGSVKIQIGWVVFDLAVLAGLFVLCKRWRQWLALILAMGISLDAIATLLEILTFNLPRPHPSFEWLIWLTALAAPTATALLLWASIAHRAGRLSAA